MGNSRKHPMRTLIVVTLVCVILFSSHFTLLGKADSPIVINSDESYASSANVTLTLSSVDANTFWMHFSNDSSFKPDDLEPYSTTKAWTLTGGEGLNTVYVQFLDMFSVPLGTYSDTIILDILPPTLTISSPASDSWSKASSFDVSGTASDAGSGLSKVEYQVDSFLGSWGLASGTEEWSFTVPTLSNGAHTIYVRATDNLDKTTIKSIEVNVDTVAPSVSIVAPIDGAYVNGGGFTVSGTATDGDGSGVEKVEVKVDHGTYALADGSTSWSLYLSDLSDRSHTIYVKATDRVGGSYETSVSVASDGSTPETSVTYSGTMGSNGWFTTAVTATLTSTDIGGSGVKEIHYKLDGGTEQIVSGITASVSISMTGSHNLLFWAVDKAGNNESPPNTETVKIDLTSPTTTNSLSGTSVVGETNWYTGTVKVTLSSSDGAGSGVANTYYKLDDAISEQVYTTPFNINALGTTKIYYYSIDKAGNREPTQTTTVNIAYPVIFTASGLPAETSWSVTLDGTTKSSTESAITLYAKTVNPPWSVINPLSGGTGIQYVTSTPQDIIDPAAQTTVGISYVKQFQLTVASAYGSPTGAGWYTSGSTANFAVTSPALGGTGTRYMFTMWTGGPSSTSPSGSIIMDSAKVVTANWQTQYQVTFNVAPLGGGTTSPADTTWVNAGSSISIAATAGSNYLFTSWTNTAGTTTNSAFQSTTATITRPGSITANFELKPGADPTATPTPTPDPTTNPTNSPNQAPNTTPKPTVKPTSPSATATPTPTATKPPVTNYVSRSVLATSSSGSTYITLYGNINGSDISNAVISSDQANSKTTLSLTFLGQSGSNTFCNITVPKRALTVGTVPTVYINNQVVESQGFTQDDGDYYVWYNTPRNTYDVSIIFAGGFEFPFWIILPVIMIVIVFTAVIVKPKFGPRGGPLLMSRNAYDITDYEISNGILKFYNSKGLVDKNRAPVREIPISKISSIERFWNEMSVTWNDIIDTFHRKGASDSFYQEVITKVQTMIDENKKAQEKQEKVRLRNLSLDKMIGGTIPVVDTVFDLLRGLHGKRIDWFDLENLCSILGQSLELTTERLPPLTLDFSSLSGAVAKQDPREVVDSARGILKVIHDYFNSLKGDDVADVHPNFDDATLLINSYYMLNDVLLGKIVGQNDNPREHRSLDRILNRLGKQTSFKVNLEELQASLTSLGAPDVDSENVVDDTREIFKEPLSQLYSVS